MERGTQVYRGQSGYVGKSQDLPLHPDGFKSKDVSPGLVVIIIKYVVKYHHIIAIENAALFREPKKLPAFSIRPFGHDLGTPTAPPVACH